MSFNRSFKSAALTLDQQTGKYILNYTKHYYAGSQRINSKLGKGKDVGQFNCGWLIIPFGAGSAAINEKAVAKEKLEANTTASLAIMAANGITPPPNYGQNAGYTENCVSSYTGVEEKDTYWYHPDHLGSSSFITGLDGEVTQNIEYFPSGEVFVEIDGGDSPIPLKTINKERDKIIRILTIPLISLMVRNRMMKRDTTIMGQGTTILG